MGTYILVNRNKKDKRWWNELIRACVRIGDPFEIYCWYDESDAMMWFSKMNRAKHLLLKLRFQER